MSKTDTAKCLRSSDGTSHKDTERDKEHGHKYIKIWTTIQGKPYQVWALDLTKSPNCVCAQVHKSLGFKLRKPKDLIK